MADLDLDHMVQGFFSRQDDAALVENERVLLAIYSVL
jgi:hypothetical protein